MTALLCNDRCAIQAIASNWEHHCESTIVLSAAEAAYESLPSSPLSAVMHVCCTIVAMEAPAAHKPLYIYRRCATERQAKPGRVLSSCCQCTILSTSLSNSAEPRAAVCTLTSPESSARRAASPGPAACRSAAARARAAPRASWALRHWCWCTQTPGSGPAAASPVNRDTH